MSADDLMKFAEFRSDYDSAVALEEFEKLVGEFHKGMLTSEPGKLEDAVAALHDLEAGEELQAKLDGCAEPKSIQDRLAQMDPAAQPDVSARHHQAVELRILAEKRQLGTTVGDVIAKMGMVAKNDPSSHVQKAAREALAAAEKEDDWRDDPEMYYDRLMREAQERMASVAKRGTSARWWKHRLGKAFKGHGPTTAYNLGLRIVLKLSSALALGADAPKWEEVAARGIERSGKKLLDEVQSAGQKALAGRKAKKLSKELATGKAGIADTFLLGHLHRRCEKSLFKVAYHFAEAMKSREQLMVFQKDKAGLHNHMAIIRYEKNPAKVGKEIDELGKALRKLPTEHLVCREYILKKADSLLKARGKADSDAEVTRKCKDLRARIDDMLKDKGKPAEERAREELDADKKPESLEALEGAGELHNCDDAVACAKALCKFLHHYDKVKAYLWPSLLLSEYVVQKVTAWQGRWEHKDRSLYKHDGVKKRLCDKDHHNCTKWSDICYHNNKTLKAYRWLGSDVGDTIGVYSDDSNVQKHIDRLLNRRNSNAKGRIEAAQALGRMEYEARYALDVLRKCGAARKYVPTVFERGKDPDKDVREACREAVQKIETAVAEVEPELKRVERQGEILNDREKPVTDKERIRAAKYLAKVQEPPEVQLKAVGCLKDYLNGVDRDEALEYPLSDRVQHFAIRAADDEDKTKTETVWQVVAEACQEQGLEGKYYERLFLHDEPAQGIRFSRFVGYAGMTPDILFARSQIERVKRGLEYPRPARYGGKAYEPAEGILFATSFQPRAEGSKEPAKIVRTREKTVDLKDFASARHFFDGDWTHTFQFEEQKDHNAKEKDAKSLRLAYLLNHVYSDIEHRGKGYRFRKMFKRAWKDMNWTDTVLNVVLVSGGVLISVATGGAAAPVIIGVGATWALSREYLKAEARDAGRKAARSYHRGKVSGAADESERAFALDRVAESDLERLVGHALSTQKNFRRLTMLADNPDLHDPDGKMVFYNCQQAGEYAWATLKFQHHYVKTVRYLHPLICFLDLVLKHVKQWDADWRGNADSYLTEVEKVASKDEPWHDEHCGCQPMKKPSLFAARGAKSFDKVVTSKDSGSLTSTLYCYGVPSKWRAPFNWEPRRPIYPVTFQHRTVPDEHLHVKKEHAEWIEQGRKIWDLKAERQASKKAPAAEPEPKKKKPAPAAAKTLEDWLRDNSLRRGWASAQGNNCLLHTLYQLFHNVKHWKEADVGKDVRDAVEAMRVHIVAEGWAAHRALLDVYGQEAQAVLDNYLHAQPEFTIQVVECRGENATAHSPRGEGGNTKYLLWQMNHFTPLWPQP